MHHFYGNNQNLADDSSSDDEYANNNDIVIEYDDSGSENSGESELEDYEDIYNAEQDYVESEKEDGSYCIGTCLYDNNQDANLLSIAIKSNTFMIYPFRDISRYLQIYSCTEFPSNKVEILKMSLLHKSQQTNSGISNYTIYSCIIKTYWLRLVQRHWRKVFAERQRIIRIRMKLNSRIILELTGQYPEGARHMPTLYGMLGYYSNHMMIM